MSDFFPMMIPEVISMLGELEILADRGLPHEKEFREAERRFLFRALRTFAEGYGSKEMAKRVLWVKRIKVAQTPEESYRRIEARRERIRKWAARVKKREEKKAKKARG